MPTKEKEENAALRQEIKRLRSIISKLTPNLESLLKQHGFTIHRCESDDDLLLPDESRIDQFYKIMKKYSFRLFLRDVIKYQNKFTIEQVMHYATLDVTSAYILLLMDLGLIEQFQDHYRLKRRPVHSFGATLEWFLAEIFKREFSADAIWGVKFKKIQSGGDYDLIAKIDSAILYMEAKSSPPRQVYSREIAAFLNRTDDLNPAIAIFFMDTELRMKDKIVPLFEEALRKRHQSPPAVSRMEKELFQIADKIFIINAKGNITSNIEKVLCWYFRKQS